MVTKAVGLKMVILADKLRVSNIDKGKEKNETKHLKKDKVI